MVNISKLRFILILNLVLHRHRRNIYSQINVDDVSPAGGPDTVSAAAVKPQRYSPPHKEHYRERSEIYYHCTDVQQKLHLEYIQQTLEDPENNTTCNGKR